jgi:UDP-N-acetylmuramoyl-L-alanine---L-glutamate ligase
LVLTWPDSAPRIRAVFARGAAAAPATQPAAGTGQAAAFAGVADHAGLEAAVAAGFRWARPDGLVLLSPAAPSFGRFRDYRDRGEAFARAMHTIADHQAQR